MLPLSVAALALLVALLIYSCYQLALQHGRLLLRVEALERLLADGEPARVDQALGLPLGTIGNDFDLPALSGGRGTLSDLQGRRVLLVFVAPDCPHSRQSLHALASLPPCGDDGEPALLIVSSGEAEANRALVAPSGVRASVLLQDDWEVGELYGIILTPSAYLLDEQGAVSRPLAVGTRALLDLACGAPSDRTTPQAHPATPDSTPRRARIPLGTAAPLAPLSRGTAAPAFRLPYLLPCPDGAERSLADYAGRPLLLIFSDPWCAPCQELAPALEAFHRRPGAPEVLVVSRHDREANLARIDALGLTFPVALQPGWELSRRFGILATPAAYLVDGSGMIADGPAIGASEVRDLVARVSSPEAPLPVDREAAECGDMGPPNAKSERDHS